MRFKDAMIGLILTLAPIAVIAFAQYLLAPHTVEVVGHMDPKIDSWAVSTFRSNLADSYLIVASILIAYWLLIAIIGGKRILEIKSANFILVLSGLTFSSAMAIASLVPVPTAFKGVCPILELSDAVKGFGFDRQSPCENFLFQAVPTLLLGLPLILLATSALLRVSGSRRQ